MSKGKKLEKDAGGNDWFTEGRKLMKRDRNGKVSHESNVGPDFNDSDLKKVVKQENLHHYYPKKRSR